MGTNGLATFSFFKNKFMIQVIVQGKGQGSGDPVPHSHSGTQAVGGSLPGGFQGCPECSCFQPARQGTEGGGKHERSFGGWAWK